ncbi:hypothetical protein [Massilibacteroides sp.]|uniref:hypothetical protein n=1 Tax=Massilibacteroides sp. TaxID=2034766 RepID=UPI0026368725|nr:hypothetical protein [Massilibacteroides sp.]MDD4514913.1 hypothetical protein [Massilibacteroides sp.]
MAVFSFFKVRKPRKFEHKPIYWDPRKEKLEERELRIKRELGVEKPSDEYKPLIKGTFIEGTSHLKKSIERGDSVDSRKYKNVRLAIILVVLAFLGWFIFLR